MEIDYTILKDISVIIQGKILGLPEQSLDQRLTLQCIQSVRRFIPEAEIILSTWEGSDTSDLPYDKLVLSPDPGGTAYWLSDPSFLNNNNRQIVSTIGGLREATKKYAIKMRGDCKITGTSFLKYMRNYPRSAKHCFFEQRVVIPTHFSRNIRRIPQLIHPSDLFQFGLTTDLLDLWDIPLQPEPETTRAYPPEKKIINNSLESNLYRMRYGAEQYIWHAFTKKNGLTINLEHFGDLPIGKLQESDFSIINNFVIVESSDLGVQLPKRFLDYQGTDLYTHEEWKTLSNQYAQGVSLWFSTKLLFMVYLANLKVLFSRAYEKYITYGLFKYKMKAAQVKVRNDG